MEKQQKTEIIAFCSGKGGTGKTLMCSCFGYALVRGGQKVLMIDGDPATDGLSLFLLGPKGKDYVVRSFFPINTFVGILHDFQKTSNVSFEPHTIHRRAEDDHGVSYDAIISGKGLYGDEAELTAQLAVPDLDQATFRAGVKMLFDALRASGEYSYVLVDTRGGFAFESTDVCALADSFIVVTEPDVTSFYQDRNLVSRINRAAAEMQSPSVLRAMLVNKGVDVMDRKDRPYLDNIEVSFRNELTKEFGVPFHTTHGVPVDIDALLAYKTQKIPYIYAPGSLFSFATLSAFSDILEIVTSRWSTEQVDRWNELVNKVTAAVKEKSAREQQQDEERLKREREFEELRTAMRERDAAIAVLNRDLAQQSQLYEREYQRTQVLLDHSLTPLPARSAAAQPKAKSGEMATPEQARADARNEETIVSASSPSRSQFIYIIIGIVLALLIAGLGYMAYQAHIREVGYRETLNQLIQANQQQLSNQQTNASAPNPSASIPDNRASGLNAKSKASMGSAPSPTASSKPVVQSNILSLNPTSMTTSSVPLLPSPSGADVVPAVIPQSTAESLLIHKVAPEFTDEARRNRTQGTVKLRVVVGKDGYVKNVYVIDPVPDLTDAAIAAVKQWQFKPYVVKGQPIEFQFVAALDFTFM